MSTALIATGNLSCKWDLLNTKPMLSRIIWKAFWQVTLARGCELLIALKQLDQRKQSWFVCTGKWKKVTTVKGVPLQFNWVYYFYKIPSKKRLYVCMSISGTDSIFLRYHSLILYFINLKGMFEEYTSMIFQLMTGTLLNRFCKKHKSDISFIFLQNSYRVVLKLC